MKRIGFVLIVLVVIGAVSIVGYRLCQSSTVKHEGYKEVKLYVTGIATEVPGLERIALLEKRPYGRKSENMSFKIGKIRYFYNFPLNQKGDPIITDSVRDDLESLFNEAYLKELFWNDIGPHSSINAFWPERKVLIFPGLKITILHDGDYYSEYLE